VKLKLGGQPVFKCKFGAKELCVVAPSVSQGPPSLNHGPTTT